MDKMSLLQVICLDSIFFGCYLVTLSLGLSQVCNQRAEAVVLSSDKAWTMVQFDISGQETRAVIKTPYADVITDTLLPICYAKTDPNHADLYKGGFFTNYTPYVVSVVCFSVGLACQIVGIITLFLSSLKRSTEDDIELGDHDTLDYDIIKKNAAVV